MEISTNLRVGPAVVVDHTDLVNPYGCSIEGEGVTLDELFIRHAGATARDLLAWAKVRA